MKRLGMWGKTLFDEKDKSESDSPPQAAVHHDELLRPVQLLDPVPVSDIGEEENTENTTYDTGEDSADHEPPVPTRIRNEELLSKLFSEILLLQDCCQLFYLE